jgi:2-polyprenyl-6-methoxyphenol hydroxylase-like FAD-dependent oxidoreductase
VTATQAFDVAIVGGGPVGLVAALEISKHSSTVLISDRLPDAAAPPRLEAVPSAFVNLLISIGVHPGRIGVDRLHDARYIAWEQSSPHAVSGPPAAYLERPALEGELFQLVARCGRVSALLESVQPSFDGTWWHGPSWRARSLIDASGRRAVCANHRVRPSRPWVARTFLTLRGQIHSDRTLRIAALPFGYAYRLGSGRYDTIGLVGRGGDLGGPPGKLERAIRRNGGDWILAGLPGLATLAPGPAYPVSVQWGQSMAVMAIGDAVLARDILSSQGLANGVSEAFYAAAIGGDEDRRLFRMRQLGQREAHLAALADLIATCRFRDRENWSEYRAFVAKHRTPARAWKKVGLAAGRLVEQ